MRKIKKNIISGLSLIEILIVITIFSILGIIVSTSLVLTIQGTKKSESLIRVRENLNYSLAVIERNLRNAHSVTVCAKVGDVNPDAFKTITYLDQNGKLSSFSCVNTGLSNSYVASGSAKLSADSIKIVNCSFSCSQPTDLSSPPFVTVSMTAQDALNTGKLTATVSAETKVYLRN